MHIRHLSYSALIPVSLHIERQECCFALRHGSPHHKALIVEATERWESTEHRDLVDASEGSIAA